MLLFHIAKKNTWKKRFEKNKENFINCCTFSQILYVANKFFKNSKEKFQIICLNENYLKEQVQWKKNEYDKAIYPSIYGNIKENCIVKFLPLEKNLEGNFFISEELFNLSKYEKSCGAIICKKFENQNKFLLIGFCFGKKIVWGFPKGHVESNEKELETVRREVKEEVNLEININENARAFTYFSCKKGITIEAVYFAAKYTSNEVFLQKSEVQEYKWCNQEELYNCLTFDCDKQIFNKLKNFFT